MKRRFSLFTYPVMDLKAAQAMLNRRAAAGWRLERIWMGVLASFVPADKPVSYCIDWSDPAREDEVDYQALLADAGWVLRQQITYRNIYEAPAGTLPIQTDGELEYQRFRKKVLRRMGIGAACMAMYLLFMLFLPMAATGGWSDWRRITAILSRSDTMAVLLLLLPPLLLLGLAWQLRMGWRLFQWRTAIRTGRELPVPGGKSAAAAVFCNLGGIICLWIVLAGMLLDVLGKNIQVPTLIGIAIGTVLGGLVLQQPESRRRKRDAMGILVAALAALVATIFLPDGLTDSLHVQIPEAWTEPIQAQQNVVWIKEEGSILAYYGRWESIDGEENWIRAEVCSARGELLADWIEKGALAELGRDGTVEEVGMDAWRVRVEAQGGQKWLIRRRNALMLAEGDEALLLPLVQALQEVDPV